MRTITKAALTREVKSSRLKESALITTTNNNVGLIISLDLYNDLRMLCEDWVKDTRGSSSITFSNFCCNLSGFLKGINDDNYSYKALRIDYKNRPSFVLISNKWADLIKD